MNAFFISAILSLLIYVFVVVFIGGRKNKKMIATQQEIPLSDIAELWADSQRSGQLHIKDIAPLWRRSTISAGEKSEYVFRYPAVEQWFSSNIDNQPWFDQAEAHKEICYQILRMLEKEECPSVVNPSNDVEASWDTNTYNLLGRTNLLDHTLHVAEFTIELLMEAEAHHVIPDAMIAALGHDLGKLPSNRTHLYSLGEHPLAAGRILAEIKYFKELSRKEEISKAIKSHHMRPDGLIGKTLKKADQKARQQELEEGVELQPDQQVNESSSSSTSQNLARQADADIYGDQNNQTPARAIVSSQREINISSWFDAEIFLTALKPYINRVQGRRFMAFSMPNGYIYFQAKAIEEVTRKMAEKAGSMDIATMAEKDKTMQKVLFSVVNRLRVEHDLIAQDLIGDQYFGGYFNVRMDSGKVLKGYYTPFKAEAFGSIAEMENEKKGVLKNITSVDIYQD